MSTSLTQYGITWTWQEDQTTGQYANGDYWVIGPITLTGITGTNDDATVRASVSGLSTAFATATVNGSMINPISGNPNGGKDVLQGFDSRLQDYTESLNIARQGGAVLSGSNTRSVPAGSSICSTSSRILSASNSHAFLNDFAILTVVTSAPAAGAFRPPYQGTDKSFSYNKSALNYSILKNVTPDAGFGAPTSSAFTRPWMMVNLDYNQSRDFAPYNNQPEYDADMGGAIQLAMLALHQNYSNATKELAYIRMVQYGIDCYGALKYGDNGADSEHGGRYAAFFGNTCQKGPVVLAALALNHADMKLYCDSTDLIWIADQYNPDGEGMRFGIDSACAYVVSGNVNATLNDAYVAQGASRQRLTYTSQMVGLPEFLLENGEVLPNNSGSNWALDYRNVRYRGLVGQILAAQMTTGAKTLWNWNPTFDYFDRAFKTYDESTIDVGLNAAIQDWWNTYRVSLGAAVWTQAAPISGVAWIPVAGTTLNIEYTDNVTTGAGGNGGLTLNMSGGAVTATYSSGNGTHRRTYTLSRTIGAGETLGTYSYTQPGNGIENPTSGADVPSVTNAPVVNYVANESGGGGGRAPTGGTPTVLSATINSASTTFTLNLSESCTTGAGGNGGLTLSATSGGVTATYSSGSGSSSYIYSLSRIIYSNETVTCTYVQPGSGIEATTGTIDLASFTAQAVTNNSTVAPSGASRLTRKASVVLCTSCGSF